MLVSFINRNFINACKNMHAFKTILLTGILQRILYNTELYMQGKHFVFHFCGKKWHCCEESLMPNEQFIFLDL